jgi:hypothetical protein
VTTPIAPQYRKSSFCGHPGCVEVAALGDTAGVTLRDSKDASSPELTFTVQEWEAFVAGVKAGEFDHQALATPRQA